MTTPLTTPMVLAMNTKTRQGTRAVWAGEEEYLLGATQVPVVLSVAFGYKDMEEWLEVAKGKAEGHIYTRNSNPTIHVFEEKVRLLEDAEAATSAASGMGIISSTLFALLASGHRHLRRARRRRAPAHLSDHQPDFRPRDGSSRSALFLRQDFHDCRATQFRRKPLHPIRETQRCALGSCWFEHTELANGGTLELELGPGPNQRWGVAGQSTPAPSDR